MLYQEPILFGLKFHALAFKKKGRIPFPESIIFTSALDNDLTVFKQIWGDKISNRTILGDKEYSDFEYFSQTIKRNQNIEMRTPVKNIKDESDQKRKRKKAYNDLFSMVVSKVRQPIESFSIG